jgi:hypothetical protein
MPSEDAPISHAEKLKALRQIQYALLHSKHPTLRACGLTQDVAATVANELLIEIYIVADEGSDLDRYVVNKIAASGLGILAQGDVAEPSPLKISVMPRHESAFVKIRRTLVSGLWDVIKIALGIPVGILVGWFIWKHHWQ